MTPSITAAVKDTNQSICQEHDCEPVCMNMVDFFLDIRTGHMTQKGFDAYAQKVTGYSDHNFKRFVGYFDPEMQKLSERNQLDNKWVKEIRQVVSAEKATRKMIAEKVATGENKVVKTTVPNTKFTRG